MTMRTIAFVSLLLSASCAVGPDFKQPDPPAVTGYTRDQLPLQTASVSAQHGSAQRLVSDMDIPAQWWRVFHSEPLNQLIEQSIAANPNITAARAALRQAQENAAAQRGFYYPSVAAEFSASRNLTPTASLSPASAAGNPYYSLITPQLTVSFVPDLFGANRWVEITDVLAQRVRDLGGTNREFSHQSFPFA